MDEFKYVVDRLNSEKFTRKIGDRIKTESKFKTIADEVSKMLFKFYSNDIVEIDRAIDDFISISKEFLIKQPSVDEEEKYKYNKFADVKTDILDSEDRMKRYLNGLLLSQGFWINHNKIVNYYLKEFCHIKKKRGKVLEVPTGHGYFSYKFEEKNPDWECTGYDISKYSVDFTKRLFEEVKFTIDVKQKDFFTLEGKYDRIICGEFLEHVEDPKKVIGRLHNMIKDDGKVFLTTAIWAHYEDHLYLFKNVDEVRDLIKEKFDILDELVLDVYSSLRENMKHMPVNYACILKKR